MGYYFLQLGKEHSEFRFFRSCASLKKNIVYQFFVLLPNQCLLNCTYYCQVLVFSCRKMLGTASRSKNIHPELLESCTWWCGNMDLPAQRMLQVLPLKFLPVQTAVNEKMLIQKISQIKARFLISSGDKRNHFYYYIGQRIIQSQVTCERAKRVRLICTTGPQCVFNLRPSPHLPRFHSRLVNILTVHLQQ